MKNKTSKLVCLWQSATGFGSYSLRLAALLAFGLLNPSSLLADDSKALEHCESCHAEQASEFEASVHYINRSGVQAWCNSCHAFQKHKDGANTSKEVTTKRLDLALREWKRMSANKSQECISCHSPMAMDLAKQEPRSVAAHEASFDAGDSSCINCHKGISHYLPDGWQAVAKEAGL